MTPAEKLREFCLGLPDTSESSHFGSAAFKVGKKLFATCNGAQIVLGLEPDHADALIANDPRWTRYARDPNALVIKTADVTDWEEIADLLRASYDLALRKTRKRATTPRKPGRATTPKKPKAPAKTLKAPAKKPKAPAKKPKKR
jgi:predicted DNA-binding protein (MmcQ/YjbR family)